MARIQSRRSFFVDCMSLAAKAVLLVGGGGLLAACEEFAAKYGVPVFRDMSTPADAPVDQSKPDDMPVVKYGVPPDLSVPTDGPTTKYGGPLVG